MKKTIDIYIEVVGYCLLAIGGLWFFINGIVGLSR